MAFTGDAVLIRGCGRTDFQVHNFNSKINREIFFSSIDYFFIILQGGSSQQLYESVHSQART